MVLEGTHSSWGLGPHPSLHTNLWCNTWSHSLPFPQALLQSLLFSPIPGLCLSRICSYHQTPKRSRVYRIKKTAVRAAQSSDYSIPFPWPFAALMCCRRKPNTAELALFLLKMPKGDELSGASCLNMISPFWGTIRDGNSKEIYHSNDCWF